MTQWWSVITLLGTPVLAVLGVLITGRAAVKAQRVESENGVEASRIAAEQGAFDRATIIYERGSGEQEKRITRLNERADALERELQSSNQRSDKLESKLEVAVAEGRANRERGDDLERALRQSVEECQATRDELRALHRSVVIYDRRVQQLEAALRDAKVPVPPWDLGPGDAEHMRAQGHPDPTAA